MPPDDVDPDRWPEAALDHLPVLDRWRALSALQRLDLAVFRGTPDASGAMLRLWERGRRSDAVMADHAPKFAHAPRWVNALLSAAGTPEDLRALLLDEELLRAAEAVVRLAPSSADAQVEVRKMLTGDA